MIFVTVGTQLGFDRLVEAVDSWAKENPGQEVFVQYGRGNYRPRWCDGEAFTAPATWEEKFRNAERVVSHAGMGTILKALDTGKPLIVMPRLSARGEHRDDHQCATVRRFAHSRAIRVVNDADEVVKALDEPFDQQPPTQPSPAVEGLLQAIREFAQR